MRVRMRCDKSDTYHTCDIASLILFPPPSQGTQNWRPERRCQGRARAALGDDDAAVNLDCDVNDVTRPVLVTTINTTDGNAASRDSKMVGWGDNRRATGAAEGYCRRDDNDTDGRTWRRRRRSGR